MTCTKLDSVIGHDARGLLFPATWKLSVDRDYYKLLFLGLSWMGCEKKNDLFHSSNAYALNQ